MAEAIVFTLAGEILKKLASTTLDQVCMAVVVKRELNKLEDTLATIKAVLLDAEQKQSTNHQLRLWLQRLQQVLYDAANILDEFEYIAIQRRLLAHDSTGSSSKYAKVRHFYSRLKFHFGMSNKFKELREKLDHISSNKAQFHLTEGLIDMHVMQREITHSFVNSSDVIGRDTDKENIIHLLTRRNIDSNLSVLPIVGIGGLGKTTIAKLVYNDRRVDECFQLKMWVCVSDDFDKQKLTKDIIVAATHGGGCSGLSFDLLQTRLRDTLKGKKFLLVLDDVWNENKQQWNELKQLLVNGAKGSKIIVTTRSHEVALIMGTIEAYSLKLLSYEDCWSLFSKCAFGEGEEKNYQNLVRIGKDIINKCKSVPLAVISLGSMLFMKTDEREWLFIEKNEIWRLDQNKNDILPALGLSYTQLPSHLKNCFSICSIFPKDFEFVSRDLIALWMSHGLIQSSVYNEELELTGIRYIKELWSRCFFQDLTEADGVDGGMKFKMHDLVHDLALLVTQNECYTINKVPMPGTISNKIRHLSICITEEVDLGSIEFDMSNLWTFNNFQNSMSRGAKLSQECIPKFKCLRMLDMRWSSFEVLPESIGSLKHLRYLNLSYNRNMTKLPDEICKLFHLQTLDLGECFGMQRLPKDIGNLINLRTLLVKGEEINLSRNTQIGLLTNLRHLYMGMKSWVTCSLSDGVEMECTFRFLRSLRVTRGWRVKCWPGIMKHLPALEELEITDCSWLTLTEDLKFPNLRSLTLDELPRLEALPEWIQVCSNTLHSLTISDCRKLTMLPDWIQNLTSLHQLVIDKCTKISEMPQGISNLTTLSKLIILDCPKLSKRCKWGKDWHKIQHIPNVWIDLTWFTGRNEDQIVTEKGSQPMTLWQRRERDKYHTRHGKQNR